MASVREATWDVLRSRGLTTVFGNPGSTELGFLQDFPADLRYVLGLQESAVVAMADGYAQAAGTAAFVSLHSACGLGNAMGAIVNAYHNKTPLVIMSGQQDRRHLAVEPYLYARSVELARPYVKWSHEPARAADVPAALARAHAIAMQPPRGPAFVSVPASDWDKPAHGAVPDQVIGVRAGPDPDTVERLVVLLRGSRRPVIITGGDVDADAWEPVVSLAGRLAAPVWAAPQAPRAGFPEDHPLFRGHLPAAREPMARCLLGHDLALLLGAPAFAYLTYEEGNTPLPPFAQITEDPDEVARAASVLGIACNVRLAAERLLAGLPSPRMAAGPAPSRPVPPRQLPDTPIHPAYLMQELAAALPGDAVLLEESPSNRAEMREHIRIRRPASFYASASGGLGFAMAAAVGVKLARPERPVVCLVGDGSAMYAPQALWTAAQHDASVLFVVANNAQYGILRMIAAKAGREGTPGMLLPGVDYVGLSRSLGCAAWRVERACELPDALRRGLSRGPCLLEVVLAAPSSAAMETSP